VGRRETAATAGKRSSSPPASPATRSGPPPTIWPDNRHTTLRYRGFTKENIHTSARFPTRTSTGDGNLDDIDGESTFSQAADLFTNARRGTGRLFVYLVDHRGNSSATAISA
jgi:hypothetical protein